MPKQTKITRLTKLKYIANNNNNDDNNNNNNKTVIPYEGTLLLEYILNIEYWIYARYGKRREITLDP